MRNPLRDEGAAFRLVLAAIGYFGLIAVGSWISTWLGLAVFVLLTAGALWFVWTGRRERPARHRVASDPGTRRILVVANETVEGAELLAAIVVVLGGRKPQAPAEPGPPAAVEDTPEPAPPRAGPSED